MSTEGFRSFTLNIIRIDFDHGLTGNWMGLLAKSIARIFVQR